MHICVLLISKREWYVENLVTDTYYNDTYVCRVERNIYLKYIWNEWLLKRNILDKSHFVSREIFCIFF